MTAPTVVILAAGRGTRMRSATPKLLHPLCGRPMIAWPVAAAREAGAAKIVVVDSPERTLAQALQGENVEVVIQEQARGTADAVQAAAPHFQGGGPVIVLAGDVPLISGEMLRALADAHRLGGAAATMATTVLEDPTGYGRVVRAPDGTVERVVETKAAGDAGELELLIHEVNTGIFAFDGSALAEALTQVRADNAQGEFYLPDVLPLLRSRERTVIAHEVSDPALMLGVNDRAALATARAAAQSQIHRRHMLSGVTIVDPSSTLIDVGVSIAADVTIEPFTSLRGSTTVATGATVGPLSTVIDTDIGERATVIHSYAQEAVVGAEVKVGPFAYLRPGAVLRVGAKAGTFVEIKNSEIGPGSKVPHLSYIGDTTIGENSNIGAGTITANYDGYRKHRTVIGSGVRVSVDTSLVAPVSIGDDAYTAAGSVVTRDVPPGSLAVARSRQHNIDGYSESRKQRAAEDGKPDR